MGKITAGELKKRLADVDDDVDIMIRTDYYYEHATQAYYDGDYIHDAHRNVRGPVFIIE